MTAPFKSRQQGLAPASCAAPPRDMPEPANRPRMPLGQYLVETGKITPADKLRGLETQALVDARLGEILVARELIDRDTLLAAVAAQHGAEVADLAGVPPDVSLIDRIGVMRCLKDLVLPWQRRGAEVVVACARPETFVDLRPGLEDLFGPVRLAVTGEAELHEAILSRHPRILAAKAETRVPAEHSCRAWPSRTLPAAMAGLAVALLVGVWVAPVAVFFALLAWTLLTLVLQTGIKLAAWIVQARSAPPDPAANGPLGMRLPTVSVLVPLYREREIATRLIERLKRLDYPPESLDICLIVESDDETTAAAIDAAMLPRHFRRIVVPDGPLKTKPRALNYALDFARGSIIGVYDAEDAPAPDQIRRVAERFHTAPPEVVCLQGVLDYYNAHSNWLARCFTIEYATWFRVILPGMMRLGMVIPLGGTTLFFRRSVLEELGGWDAHNVTEDADLGIRLARMGYRTELIPTVTAEEANCRVWPWIKQRSRWLKGYAVTWAVHSRNPLRLWRELGHGNSPASSFCCWVR